MLSTKAIIIGIVRIEIAVEALTKATEVSISRLNFAANIETVAAVGAQDAITSATSK